jgi:hypothetical protein
MHHLFVGTYALFDLNGYTQHLFVGTQDLCVQSNPTFHPAFSSGWESFCWPGFIGLDAKILRPYKQYLGVSMHHQKALSFVIKALSFVIKTIIVLPQK